MKIYTRIQKFDRDTGKPIFVKQFDHIRCDYTGEIVDEDYCDDYRTIYCCYDLNYRDSDPCFGSGGIEYDFERKYDIDAHEFLYETYHFIDGLQSEEHYAGLNMMKEAINNLHNKESPWHCCFSFDHMCRTARILTASKLIKDGVIEAWQLTET